MFQECNSKRLNLCNTQSFYDRSTHHFFINYYRQQKCKYNHYWENNRNRKQREAPVKKPHFVAERSYEYGRKKAAQNDSRNSCKGGV